MIALGTPVTYHHRAAVARFTTMGWRKERVWVLFEGAFNRVLMPGFENERDMFGKHKEIKGWRNRESINKTVMIWPEEGSGVVIGKVKRARGISHRGYGGGEDSEPGYFDATDYFNLYAVKWALDGTKYALVPEWALAPIHNLKEQV